MVSDRSRKLCVNSQHHLIRRVKLGSHRQGLKSRGIGVEILFEDNNALEVFMNHPKHFEANAIFEKHLADPPYMVLTHEIS